MSDQITGRVYTLRGEYWIVRARWAPPADQGTAACPECGRIRIVGPGCKGVYCGCTNFEVSVKPLRQGPRNVLIERVEPWLGVGMGDHWFECRDGDWWRPTGGYAWRPDDDPLRHPIVSVRPFRGLRRRTTATRSERVAAA